MGKIIHFIGKFTYSGCGHTQTHLKLQTKLHLQDDCMTERTKSELLKINDKQNGQDKLRNNEIIILMYKVMHVFL